MNETGSFLYYAFGVQMYVLQIKIVKSAGIKVSYKAL